MKRSSETRSRKNYKSEEENLSENQDPNNRTIYFGNIPNNTTIDEILRKVRGGMIDSAILMPERGCAFVSFVDSSGASIFFKAAKEKDFRIKGTKISIRWGKPSPLFATTAMAVAKGNSRNIYLGNYTKDELDENRLKTLLDPFGEIDNVRIVSDKNCAFVHFNSIMDAVRVYETLPKDEDWGSKRIYFGKDRCDRPLYGKKSGNKTNTEKIAAELGILNIANPQSALSNPNNDNRQIWIGNIPPGTTPRDVCDSIRGGMLVSLKMMIDKHCCFATFVEPSHATNFYQFCNSQGLSINGKMSKVNFGKPQPLYDKVIECLRNGATRCVYIGNIDLHLHTEQKLRQDFETIGEIESISIKEGKRAALINFLLLTDAQTAHDAIKRNQDYSGCFVRFGKDRCSGPFKGRSSGYNYPNDSDGYYQSGTD